jgi:hypothetical protein
MNPSTINLIVMSLLSLAPYLVPPMVALLTLMVSRSLAKLPVNERALVSQIAQTSVHATEQYASDQMSSPGKKEMATKFVEEELANYKIVVPDVTVSNLIEQWVSQLNMAADAKPTIVIPPTQGVHLNPVKEIQ